MLRLLTQLIDLIFPLSDDDKILRSQDSKNFSSHYKPKAIEKVLSLSFYQNKNIQAAIRENKFHRNKLSAQLLGHLLEQWIVHNPGQYVFTPIPLSKKRLRERGHNQVRTILENTDLGKHILEDLLSRTRDTKPQTRLQREERIKNVKDAFCFLETNLELSGMTVVLVDDVMTTGATMKEARASLAPHLPPNTKLICLVLAH